MKLTIEFPEEFSVNLMMALMAVAIIFMVGSCTVMEMAGGDVITDPKVDAEIDLTCQLEDEELTCGVDNVN
jgi:hypothetical protein